MIHPTSSVFLALRRKKRCNSVLKCSTECHILHKQNYFKWALLKLYLSADGCIQSRQGRFIIFSLCPVSMIPLENKTKEKGKKSAESSYAFKMGAGTNMLFLELHQEQLIQIHAKTTFTPISASQ